MDTVTSTPVHSSANGQHSTASLHCIGLQAIVACLSYSDTLLSRMLSAKLTIIYIKCSHIVFAFQAMLTYYSNMLQSMDELIIAGTSSLSRAIKSIQCLRQHELCLRQHELPHHTWHTSPCFGKPSPCVGKHDVLLI